MEDIQVLNRQLPTAVEDLAKYVMVGRERLVALQAELRAIDKVGMVDEIRQQKLLEAQDLADEVLLAENWENSFLKCLNIQVNVQI